MTTYVAEIEGHAVVAFGAENYAEAQDLITTEWLHDDLAVLESNGRPYGTVNRNSTSGRQSKKSASNGNHLGPRHCPQGEATADEIDEWVVYLVPVSDPTDNEC